MTNFRHEADSGDPNNAASIAANGAFEPARLPAPGADGGGDARLLDALSRRDREATATLLIAEHAESLGRVCMALLGSQSDAQRALLETLLAALDTPDVPNAGVSPRAWLLGIARRRCARQLDLRPLEHRQSASPEPDDARADSRTPHPPTRLRRILTKIRPTEREALVLRFTANLSIRELSQATGSDEGTARKRASRGLVRLCSLLSEDES